MVATPPRRKQELADDPFRAVKRACLECGGPIANWRNGRRGIERRQNSANRAADGKRRKTLAGLSGEGQAVLCVQTAKKTPIFIDSKPTSENREGCRMTYAIIWAE
jgi:hypothetical protein